MGTEETSQAVASDYSGRPVRRPTADEVAAIDWSDVPIDAIGVELPDGRTAVMGYGDDGDSYGFYLPDQDGGPDYDQPVDPDTGERIKPPEDGDRT